MRSSGEFRDGLTHRFGHPRKGAPRSGRIPGARNIPWKSAANTDCTFKTADELRKICEENLGLNPRGDTVAYSRIGERSSYTWFVLTYLLGFSIVRRYDRPWTEWRNAARPSLEIGA